MSATPIVPGFHPDPSVCRVGDDYYLVNSSFEYLPGVPIFHSRDLANWQQLGNVLDRPEQLSLPSSRGGGGIYAPTLRHHDGRFWMITTNINQVRAGHLIVSATDPAGPWTTPVYTKGAVGIDPDLFWDADGTCYLTWTTGWGNPPIMQAVIDPQTGKLLSEPRGVAAGTGLASPEGPHLYRRGDWYYLCSAEGGSWHGHMQTIARSRSPWGPFEAGPQNPFITHRHLVANRVQTLGHAELFEASDGSWWAVALGTRHPRMAQHHNLGRETFLLPVTWVDDWPVAGHNGDGTTSLEVPVALPEPGLGTIPEVSDTLWSRGWKNIGPALAALDADCLDGSIRLPGGTDPRTCEAGPKGALLRPQTEDDQRFEATLVSVPDGATAGIAAFADVRHYYSLMVESAEDGGRQVVLTKTVDDLVGVTAVPVPAQGPLTLRIDGHETEYSFSVVSTGGTQVVGSGSARLLSAETAQWFVGVHWTLLALGPDGSQVEFSEVGVSPLEAGRPASPVPF